MSLGESGVSLEPMTIPVKGLYLPIPSYGASSPALREGSMGTSVNCGGEVSTDGVSLEPTLSLLKELHLPL